MNYVLLGMNEGAVDGSNSISVSETTLSSRSSFGLIRSLSIFVQFYA